MRNLATAGALLALALGATSCGNQREPAPDLSALGKPGKTAAYTSDDGTLSFRFPVTWAVTPGKAPLVATLASGSALAAVYAYPREDLGTGPAAVKASRKRIIASLEDRDPGFLIERSRITEIDGSPAVEVLGRGLVAGTVVKNRVVHVFKDDTEWVINTYAVPDKYGAAREIAFDPLLRTVMLADNVKKEKG